MRSCIRLLATAATALGILAGGSLVANLAPASAAQAKIGSNTTNSQRVKLGLNKSVVIDLPSDAYDILVANPAVADAVTRTARRIYLFGKAVGETNIFVLAPMASRSSASISLSSATLPASRITSSASSPAPTSRSNC